jgi:hypothetical protein
VLSITAKCVRYGAEILAAAEIFSIAILDRRLGCPRRGRFPGVRRRPQAGVCSASASDC